MNSLPLLAEDYVDDGKMAITMRDANKVEDDGDDDNNDNDYMTMMTVLGKWR